MNNFIESQPLFCDSCGRREKSSDIVYFETIHQVSTSLSSAGDNSQNVLLQVLCPREPKKVHALTKTQQIVISSHFLLYRINFYPGNGIISYYFPCKALPNTR